MSQKDLVDVSGLSRSVVTGLCNGRGNPKLETVVAVAEGLQLDPSALIKEYHSRSVLIGPRYPENTVYGRGASIMDLLPPVPERQFNIFRVLINKGYDTAPKMMEQGSDVTVLLLEGKLLLTTEGGELLVDGVAYIKAGTVYSVKGVTESESVWTVAGKLTGPLLWL